MKKILYQEADFYGASKLIFGDRLLPACYQATWMHGLGQAFKNNVNSKILINYDEDFLPIHLVNNYDTVELLSREGIESIAVGMPYIYTNAYSKNTRNKPLYKRVFMPEHSIAGENQVSKYNEWRDIIDKYSCDAICMASIDYDDFINDKNDIFSDINIIKGASTKDPYALEKMAILFFDMEEMITNAIGSHIVYASASGVKIRIVDEIRNLYMLNSKSKDLSIFPSKVRKEFKSYYSGKSETLNKILSSIWMSGDDAEIKEYSKFLLGVDYKKDKNTLMSLLTPTSQTKKIKIISHLLFNKISRKIGL